ncbi:MAG: PLP-dependent aminotransferase family protein [Betaproteobacteria bacterium HGW-Betaproteobacteria-7]|jgi:GntR family transcriptional regulator/MocR family aminotransferase|nr:MAG: PLP-dependent aminotransferase family protein [Betaproteobacteria bacterium HGW-Betaproteobacteria-7]
MALDLILSALQHPLPPGEARQQRLYRLLRSAILDGRLSAGVRLPGSRQLAQDYRMARNGVLFAYQQLLSEGFLVADRGGTRVASLPSPTAVAPATAVPDEILSRRAAALADRRLPEELLPFAPGVADLNVFPWPVWSRFLQQAWREVSARQLAYAEPGGEPALRRSLATFLRLRRGVVCAPEQIFIVAGGQVALDACARLLADPGDRVWLENPCYQAARNTMLAAGLEVVDVPVDRDGMAPADFLWRDKPPRLLYLTPSHQYPLGSVLSLERRLAFLNHLKAGENWLIEDDYDSEFNHAQPGGRPLPAIQGLSPEAPVIYVGTFSKLLYPGLRIAYMVVPRWAVTSFGAAIAALYRGGQAVEQRALARFIESGRLTRHTRSMAPRYRQRQQVLRRALQEGLAEPYVILGGQAGLHLTVLLPEAPPDVVLSAAAASQGVAVRPLSAYFSSAGGGNGLVLGYGMAEAERIPQLVQRLRLALDK